jgi:hypothetical protein
VTEAQQGSYAALAYHRLQSEWPWLGVANYWFLKQADEREKDKDPQYYFRLLEPDFTPMPAYHALADAARLQPVMYRGYHQEDHWAVEYENWAPIEDDQAILGAYRQAMSDGAQSGFAFDGSDLWILVSHRPDGGWLEVSVDGNPPTNISLASPEVRFGSQVPIARGLPQGHHQVQITGGGGATIDGFIVRDRPIWLLQRVLGAAVVIGGLLALVWYYLRKRQTNVSH